MITDGDEVGNGATVTSTVVETAISSSERHAISKNYHRFNPVLFNRSLVPREGATQQPRDPAILCNVQVSDQPKTTTLTKVKVKKQNAPRGSSRTAHQRQDVPMVKERVGILSRMLDKTLPNLKPVELPVTFPVKQFLADQAASILRAVATGKITPSDATALMTALSAQARVVEVDDLEKRIPELEQAHGN